MSIQRALQTSQTVNFGEWYDVVIHHSVAGTLTVWCNGRSVLAVPLLFPQSSPVQLSVGGIPDLAAFSFTGDVTGFVFHENVDFLDDVAQLGDVSARFPPDAPGRTVLALTPLNDRTLLVRPSFTPTPSIANHVVAAPSVVFQAGLVTAGISPLFVKSKVYFDDMTVATGGLMACPARLTRSRFCASSSAPPASRRRTGSR